MSSKLQVDIVTDARGVGPGLDQAESRLSKFGGTVAKVGKYAAVGLAGGLAAAGAAAFKLAQGAAEDELGARKLEGTLRRTTGATRDQVGAMEDWITAQGKALGVADDELRPAIGKLAASTGDLGKAQQQAALAMDVAAARGVSLETVTKALERANNGSVTGLSRLGVATTDAAGKTLTLDQITGNLSKTYGGAAAEAADTAAGRWGRVQLMMGELGETIGAKLLPVGEKAAGWALGMVPKLEKFANAAGDKLGPVLSKVGGFITDHVLPAGQKLAAFVVDDLAPAFVKYATPVLEAVGRGFSKLRDAVRDNEPQLSKFGDLITKVAGFVGEKIMPKLGALVGFLVDKLFGVLSTGVDWFSKLAGWVADAADAVDKLVGWIGKIDFPDAPAWLSKVGDWVTGAVGGMVTMTPSLTGGAPGYGGAGLATAAGLVSPAWTAAARGAVTAGATAGGGVTIDARLVLQLPAGGLVDEVALAQRLEQVQRRHRDRLGALLATQLPATAGGF